MGLPGAEKTTLARVIAPRSDAVVFNVDEVHANISRDLGFRTPYVWVGCAIGLSKPAASRLPISSVQPLKRARRAFGDAFLVATASRPDALRTPISYSPGQASNGSLSFQDRNLASAHYQETDIK